MVLNDGNLQTPLHGSEALLFKNRECCVFLCFITAYNLPLFTLDGARSCISSPFMCRGILGGSRTSTLDQNGYGRMARAMYGDNKKVKGTFHSQ